MAGDLRAGSRATCSWLPTPTEDLTDEVILGREVIDDNSVADSELLGYPAVGELAQSVVERDGQGTVEDLVLGVPVAHHHLIVVTTANTVL